MRPEKRVKGNSPGYRTVGVIATPADLRKACRMSDPPDLFELRLDCLYPAKNLEPTIARLPAPLIITARHPAEGGENNLPAKTRRDLLARFVEQARYVDIELRSASAFGRVLREIRRRDVGLIVSLHDFKSSPTLGSLRAKVSRATALGAAIFKVAVRTDTASQVATLLEFVVTTRNTIPTSALGIGRLGALSRLLLVQCGSALVYTSLSQPRVEGQMSLADFRRVLRQAGIA